MILSKNYLSLKHQWKAEFKNLDDSEVLSSDFPDLRTSAASVTSTASTASVASMTFTASFHQKILILMVGSSLVPKWPIQVPFCRMYHQKSKFSLILATFLSEAAEASQCYFFENWLMKLKCPILLKPLDTMIQENYWSFYPSEPFRITRFTMRHPVRIYWTWDQFFLCFLESLQFLAEEGFSILTCS